MSVKLLEHLRDELIGSGAVRNTPEFCRAWLGRSEGYIRTLRNHGTGPSVGTMLGAYVPQGQQNTANWPNNLSASKDCVIRA
jgi:hypothetical protein